MITSQVLDRAARRLLDRRTPVVAWGSGSVFDYFQTHLHGQLPLRLDYIVDSDPARWGRTHRGVEIVPPARLAADRRNPFVVVYSSAWPEIRDAIGRLGAFDALPASWLFADAATRATLAWSETLEAPRSGGRGTRHAVVVQGPVAPGVTARVLRVLAAVNPDAQIVLSTWQDTPADVLDEASALADAVVLSARPAVGGIQNRNYQIVSTRAGIARAIERGAELILKTRTDLAVCADDVFGRGAWWLGQLDATRARAHGRMGRLIVPSSYTRKYLLYHPSDLVMLGHAADLRAYWDAPLDQRQGTLLAPAWMDQPLAAVNLSGNPAESYLGLAYCRAIGRPVAGTLRDSWAFYRDFFAVVDNSWFDLLWFKNLAIPDAALRAGIRQTVTSAFWQRLQFADLDDLIGADPVEPAAVTLRSLAGAA